MRISWWWVVVGAHELPYNNKITSMDQVENNKNIHRVKEIIIHEKYDTSPFFYYDFAIVKLETTLRFSAEIAAVCLPDPRFSASKYASQEGVVSGWGKTDIRAINTSPVLKDLKVRIFSNEECKELKNDYIRRKELSEK